MEQKQLIAVLAVVIVIAAAGIGAFFLMGGGGASETKYTVTYNSNGGNEIAPVEFTKSSETFNLTVPSRDSYNFLGWFENSNFTGSPISQIVKGTEKNITVYAKWQLVMANNAIPDSELISANSDVKVTFDNGIDPDEKIITNTALDALTAGKTLTIEDTVSHVAWTFTGADSKDAGYTAAEFDAKVTQVAAADSVTKQATLDFGHSGKLPYASTVKYYFGTEFIGQEVTIKNNSTSEILGPFTVDSEGYVEFQIDHCSVWTITVSYDVTFNANGGLIDGQSTKVIKVAYNTQVGTLPVATRTGYDTYVWDPAADPTDVITEAKTYTAQWTANGYTVAFNGNGSTSGSVVSIDATYDAQSSMPANGFTKTGYTFAGWNTAADGSGTAYQPQAQFSNLTSTNGATVTIYAQWTANSYTVAFNGNGSTSGSVDSINATYGVVIIIPPNGFTKTGHSFAGWNTAADGSGDPYQIAAEVSNLTSESGATFTLYAQWTPITYALHFNKVSDGATGTMDNQVVTYGTHPQINACTFTSNTEAFNGWALTQGGNIAFANQASLTEDLASVQDAVVDLYAVWGPYNIAANITLDENAYTGLTVTAQKGSDNPFPLIYENGSYVCRQGILDETTYKVLIGGDDTGATIVTENGTGSVNIAYFTVTFDLSGGTPAVQPVIVKSGQTVAEPQNISKTGYDLSGWKKGNTDWNFSTAIAETTTLTAQWTPQTYAVTLNPVDGAIVSGNVTQYTYGVGATLHTDMARPAYTFGGWYVNQNYSGDAVTSIGTTDTGEKTFYAKWNPVTYTLTFDSLGGSPENPITYTVEDTPLNLPANTTKTGYSLMGWYEESAPGTVMTQLEQGTYGNKTLYAKWAANAYQVVFDKNSQTATGEMAPQNFLYGADPVALTANAYSNTGFAMSGWATAADGAKVYNDGAQVQNLTAENNGTVTLYAVWEAYYIQVTVKVNDALDTRELTVKAMHNAFEYPMERISTGVYKVSSTPNASIQETGYTIYVGDVAVANTTVTQGKAEVEVNYYTVTFYTGCEVQVPTQTILSGGYAQEPQNVIRTGYDLRCWSQDSTQEVPFEFENTTISATRILDAFWNAKHYTVVYDSNEGSGAAMNNGEAVFGQEFTPAACTYTKTVQGVEWRFAGWNTVDDGSGMIFRAGQATVIDADAIAHLDNSGRIVLFAMWRDTNYVATVGDTFSGTTSYTEPNQPAVDQTFRSVVIGTGNNEYRLESNFYYDETWYFMDLDSHENGEWPVFGNLFDVAELASILSGQGQADTQQINGQTVQVTKYQFSYLQGHATGYIMTVDDTGMICRIHMELEVTSQMAQESAWRVGTYTEDVLVSGFTPAAQAETHTVNYTFEQFSERTEERSGTVFLAPEDLGFTKDDKVFVKWAVVGEYDVFYYPGDRILTDKNVYAIWQTPNTNVNWDVFNLPPGMEILLNGTSDAWISDVSLNDYLTLPGTSGWSFSNGEYHFTFQQKSYTLHVYETYVDISAYEQRAAAVASLNDGNFRLTFAETNTNSKFYVSLQFYETAPALKGYNAREGDSFTYSEGGFSAVYNITKVPGSNGWASENTYQYTLSVAGQLNTYTKPMYEFIFVAPTSNAILISEDSYEFNGQAINCYLMNTVHITQGNGTRSVSTILECYVGQNDGIVYSLSSNESGIITLSAKSDIQSVDRHNVTFHGNGGTFNGNESLTEDVFGTNNLSRYPRYEGRSLAGWSTTQGGDVAYSTHQLITQDVELWAVWEFDGSFVIVNPGNGSSALPENQLMVPILTDSDVTRLYPADYRCTSNGQVGGTFTISGFTPFGNYQTSPAFRYIMVRITDDVPGEDSYYQIAQNVWVSKQAVQYTEMLPQNYPVESWVLLVLRNYALDVDVGYSAPVTVTFSPNGGTGNAIEAQAPQNGYVPMMPVDTFSRFGYMFIGWMGPNSTVYGYNPVLDEIPTSDRSALTPNRLAGAYCEIGTEPFTFNAVWEKVVAIHYNANGGELEDGVRELTLVKVTENAAMKTLLGGYDDDDGDLYEEHIHKNGYKLLGWATSSNATTLTYLPGDQITFSTEDGGRVINLYAIWAADDQVFRITYEKNTNMQNLTFNYEGRVYFLAAGITSPMAKAGYSFGQNPQSIAFIREWNTVAAGTGTEYNAETGTMLFNSLQDNLVLYAQWKNTATVTFLGGEGATGSMSTQEVPFKTLTALNANGFERLGYGFTGWEFTPSVPVTDAILAGNQIMVNKAIGSLTLTATWAPYRLVEFDRAGGEFETEFEDTQAVIDGQTLSVPAIAKSDYRFAGWFLSNGQAFDFEQTPITDDVSVTAKWTFQVHYHRYNVQEGDWVDDPESVVCDSNQVELPTCVARDNYTVTWNRTVWDEQLGDNVTTEYTPGTTVSLQPIGGEIELYETYLGYPFTIRFDLNGGSMDDPVGTQVFHYGDEEMLIDGGEPVLDDEHYFAGWKFNGTTYDNGRDIIGLYQANETLTFVAQYEVYE